MRVDKYDAGRKCFYSVDIDDLEKEYQSLGLTDEEVATKIEGMRQKVAEKVAEIIGADKATIKLTQDTKPWYEWKNLNSQYSHQGKNSWATLTLD